MKYILTFINFILISTCIAQTQQSITGFVQDKAGNPLEAVTVVIKGTALGTATEANGHLHLITLPEAKLFWKFQNRI